MISELTFSCQEEQGCGVQGTEAMSEPARTREDLAGQGSQMNLVCQKIELTGFSDLNCGYMSEHNLSYARVLIRPASLSICLMRLFGTICPTPNILYGIRCRAGKNGWAERWFMALPFTSTQKAFCRVLCKQWLSADHQGLQSAVPLPRQLDFKLHRQKLHHCDVRWLTGGCPTHVKLGLGREDEKDKDPVLQTCWIDQQSADWLVTLANDITSRRGADFLHKYPFPI